MDKVETFVVWERKLALRRTVVLFTTLWLTWRSFEWATLYAASIASTDEQGIKAAATIFAVTAPVTYLQKVVFEQYIKAK